MKLSDAEKALIKEVCHGLADKILPGLIEAEKARLPDSYHSIVDLAVKILIPQIQAAIDTEIGKI